MEITQTQEKEIRIFETVLAHTTEVVPFDRFYVVLYDRRNVSLYFPLVQLEDGARLILPEIAEGPWIAHPYTPEKLWPDCLLRPNAPLPNGSNFQNWLTTHDISYQSTPQPLSALVAPLKARGAMMGVLVAEDLHREGAYGEDLQKWFTAVANRVAGTLSSLRLVESLRIVNRVGQRLTAESHQDIDKVLNLIHEQASLLLDTRDMYIALHDPGLQELSFPLAYYDGVRENWPARKLLGVGVTEEVIRSGQPLRLDDYRQWYAERGVIPPVLPEESPKSWIGVPMSSGDRVLGIIALQNDEIEGLYSDDDLDILQTMANQAAVAIANARLVERLRAVNEVGQRLTSGVRLGEGEILNLIYEQAGLLMDTRDMYIAFYNAEKQELSFPLAYYDGKRETDWPSRTANIDDLTRGGLTEEVLRTKALVCPPNVEDWYQSRNITPAVRPLPKSWLGVPLMVEDRILGVIALQNDEIECLYGPDDVEVLQTMASQCAFAVLAIENTRLLADLNKRNKQLEQVLADLKESNERLEQAQTKIAETEAALVRANVATDVVHRINNLAGTSPVWADLITAQLDLSDPHDSRINKYLQNIKNDFIGILRAAEELNKPLQEGEINVAPLLGTIVRNVQIQYSHITTDIQIQSDLLPVKAIPSQLQDSIWNVVVNGIEAMPNGGVLSIRAYNYRPEQHKGWLCLEIVDSGNGIPVNELDSMFKLFHSTKGEGRGYGLWRSKNIIEALGGQVSVQSQLNKGSTFTIKLPTIKNSIE